MRRRQDALTEGLADVENGSGTQENGLGLESKYVKKSRLLEALLLGLALLCVGFYSIHGVEFIAPKTQQEEQQPVIVPIPQVGEASLEVAAAEMVATTGRGGEAGVDEATATTPNAAAKSRQMATAASIAETDMVAMTTHKQEKGGNVPLSQPIAAKTQKAEITVSVPLPPPIALPPPPEAAPASDNVTLVQCSTTKGPLSIAVYTGWSPLGAPHFLELVRSGFFSTKVGLFRVVKNWIVQFGIAGDPAVHKFWRRRGSIKDDPQWLPMHQKGKRFKRGMISFAGGGPNTRNTEMFIALADNGLGGAKHEVPFGILVGQASYNTLDAWYSGYGELSVFGGQAPAQGKMYNRGLEYLESGFPQLDYITSCNVTWSSTPENSAEMNDASEPSRRRLSTDANSKQADRLVSSTTSAGTPAASSPIVTVLVIPSPVSVKTRVDRLRAIHETWAVALRRCMNMRLRVLLSPDDGTQFGVPPVRIPPTQAAEEAAVFSAGLPRDREVLPRTTVLQGVKELDNADRLLQALQHIYDQGTQWLFAANDHTFIVPENLRCLLDSGAAGSPLDDVWMGHRLQEGNSGSENSIQESAKKKKKKGNQNLFVSGAAGYLLSRSLLGKFLAAVTNGSCKGSRRERQQPGLLVAKCLRDVLGVTPLELGERAMREIPSLLTTNNNSSSIISIPSVGAAPEPSLHVYGPARLVSGRTDDWWRRYRSNSGMSVVSGLGCCSSRTISFHYCFGAEQRLLNDVLRSPDHYRSMSDEERKEIWPSARELGGYSYSLSHDAKARAELWRLLLEKLSISECVGTQN